ncbi:MAG: 23S rRNA (uracil-5-)-methyltransferase RumA, partial [Clostridia bacterium]|nr:23S rRNA (uracil-5-)-methyltransferase RumA [Clostridia bacterium]
LSNIDADDVVVNGFSGAGLLSGMIAQGAKQVYGIEIEEKAHLNAEKLKKENNLTNLTNLCGDFFKLYQPDLNPNVVVLDPSKKGCGAKVMQKICGVNKIIYVSCNPIALAKDLREILNFYTIESITPFDMFPNTSNVETVCVLTKKIKGN